MEKSMVSKMYLSSMISMMMLTAVAIASGCQSRTKEATPSSLSANDNGPGIVSGSVVSDVQKEKLLAAKDAFFTKLSGRLMEALSQSGPAIAIEVCHREAKKIAVDVGREQDVTIGRTGVRLRNTDNLPPHWARQLVANKVDTPTFVMLSNTHAAALLPIKLQSQCLMCHGPHEDIATEVKVRLAKLYPEDQATGFSEGELRGWFWVELLK